MNAKTKSWIAILVTVVVVAVVACLALNGLPLGDYNLLPVKDGISLGLDLRGGIYAVYIANNTDQEDFDSMMEGTISVLRNRLTAQGFTEATVTKQGTNRIRVEIPDVKDPGEILSIIGQPAHLEIRDPNGSVIIEGRDIKVARQILDNYNQPVVSFELNESGKKAFAEATANNIGKSLGIFLDDTRISNPVVQSAIPDGHGEINGMESVSDAQNLAMLIMSGALPLDIEQDELSAISATLGTDALKTSILAGIIGFILVLLFMLVMYRLPGLMADLALCIYVLIVLYALAIIPGVQLTLPGIAGILLGIGMAVDANVIIFERFREELKAGRSVMSSVDRGFKNALTAVIDSNVTTIIVAVVLIYLGTGTIKGFAITLLISVVTSMISAIFVTRFLLHNAVRLADSDKKWLFTR